MTFVADFDPQGIEKHNGINRIQWPALPGGNIFQNGIRDRRDQLGRNVDAVEIAQMTGDLACAHAAGIHRNDLVIEAWKATLIFH